MKSFARRSIAQRIDEILRDLRAAATQYGRSRSSIGLKLLSLYWLRGFRPGEALRLGLADPTIAEDALDGCFTKAELMTLQNMLNPEDCVALTEDKSVFYE